MLVQPLLKAGQGRLIYTDIFEAFFVQVKVGAVRGADAGLPGDRDAAVAVRRARPLREGEEGVPAVPADDARSSSPAGACFAYFVAMPWALHFLLSFQGNIGGIQQEALPGVGNYLTFCTRFIFGFGAAFLLPILLMILERAGIVTREQLAKSRRYAIVAAAAVAAVLTPPDVVSMLMLLVPLYGLYEFAILAIRITHWRAARKAARSGSVVRLLLGPRQKRARKRHRGGGGLAVPGPFKRIARAGGQKVTIRTAQRPFFANQFRAARNSNFFGRRRNDRRSLLRLAEIQANQRCSGRASDRAWSAAAWRARRRSARTGPFPASVLVRDEHRGWRA